MQLDVQVQQMHARTPAHSRLHGRWLMHQSKPAEHTPNLSWPRAEARPGAINTASTARRHGHSPLEFLGWPALDPSIHCRVGSSSDPSWAPASRGLTRGAGSAACQGSARLPIIRPAPLGGDVR